MPKVEKLVSVIIPCYNCEKYVEQSIRSIMEQSYKNLEIIVTNDCSTDSTMSILTKLAKEDSRIVFLNNETNLKITKTLNKMIDFAHGAYIARMDSDDISLPDRIQTQVSFLENHKDYSLCGTAAYQINEYEKIIGKDYIPITNEEIKMFLPYRSPFYHPSIMARADVYKNNHYSEDFPYAEDYELWCRFAYKLNLKMANINQKLIKYRVFEEQTCNKCHNEQNNSCIEILRHYNAIKEEDFNYYINVFLIHNQGNLEEFKYIKKIYKEFKKYPFNCVFFAYRKIFAHIRKAYPKKIIILFCLHFNMLRTIFKIIISK